MLQQIVVVAVVEVHLSKSVGQVAFAAGETVAETVGSNNCSVE